MKKEKITVELQLEKIQVDLMQDIAGKLNIKIDAIIEYMIMQDLTFSDALEQFKVMHEENEEIENN